MGLIGLDPSKSVGGAFELEGYPTLVILDRKGIVQSVHVGYDPSSSVPLNKSLAKEIDTLAGRQAVGGADGERQGGFEEDRSLRVKTRSAPWLDWLEHRAR